MSLLFRFQSFCLLLLGFGSLMQATAQPSSEFWSRLIDVSEGSYLVESRRYEESAARMALTALKKSRLPVVSVTGDLPGITRQIEPILQDDGSQAFIPRSLSYSSGFLSVRQIIPGTGTELSLISGAFRTGTFLGETSHWQTQPVIFRISQPLFRPAPYLTQMEERTRAIASAEIQRQSDSYTMLSALFKDWWRLRIAEVQVQETKSESVRLDSMQAISAQLVESGHRPYLDLVQIRKEAGYRRIDLDIQEATLRSQEKQFLITWGIPWEDCDTWDPVGLPLSLPAQEGRSFSAESKMIRLSIEAQEEEIRRLHQERLPQVSIDGLLGLNQTGNSFNEAIRDPLLSQYFSISVSHTLLDWGQAASRKEAEEFRLQAMLAEEAHQLQLESAEWTSRAIMLRDLKEVYAGRSAMLEQAQDHLEWMTSQYNAGHVDLRSLFEAKNECSQIRMQQLSLEAECWQLWLDLVLSQPDAMEYLTN